MNNPEVNIQKKSRFIYLTGIAILIFAIIAFGSAAIIQPYRVERYIKPKVIIHISLIMGWLILFIIQSRLAIKGAIQKHHKNLLIGALLVLLITLQAIWLTYEWGDVNRFIGESRDVVAFSILFIAGIILAKNGKIEAHKRLILIATLNLLTPAVTRFGFIFDWSGPITLILTILIWILIPVLYDLTTRKSIHRATIGGIVFSIFSVIVMIAMIISPIRTWIETQLFTQ